jgi:hypothetical protein
MLSRVRTTVTLDPDTEALLRRRMRERKISFKQALNDAIRDGLRGPAVPERISTPVHSMGSPRISLDMALQLAAQLEDDELEARMRAHK